MQTLCRLYSMRILQAAEYPIPDYLVVANTEAKTCSIQIFVTGWFPRKLSVCVPVRYPLTIASRGITCAFLTNMARPASRSLYCRISSGISSMSAVTKWLGMMWISFSNQKREISVRSLPLSGMPFERHDKIPSTCISRSNQAHQSTGQIYLGSNEK